MSLLLNPNTSFNTIKSSSLRDLIAYNIHINYKQKATNQPANLFIMQNLQNVLGKFTITPDNYCFGSIQ